MTIQNEKVKESGKYEEVLLAEIEGLVPSNVLPALKVIIKELAKLQVNKINK